MLLLDLHPTHNVSYGKKDFQRWSQVSKPGAGHRRSTLSSGRPALRSKKVSKYNDKLSSNYRLPVAGQVAKSGNPDLPIFDLEDDGDDSDDSDDGADDDLRNRDDLNSLLVKACETNVFPSIRY